MEEKYNGDDLIFRKDAIEAFGERPFNWTDSPEEIQAVCDWELAISTLKSIKPACKYSPYIQKIDRLILKLEAVATGLRMDRHYTESDAVEDAVELIKNYKATRIDYDMAVEQLESFLGDNM